jgi:xanthine dehydrogenase accessory factor
MRIFVIDDRSEFANSERFPEAERVLVEEFTKGLRTLPINENTFIVIATRGHRYDDVALEAAAKTNARYVALLGSKRKIILIAQALLERGMSVDRLHQIRAPAGLDIGGRTPEEIAISIMAEILMFRFGGTGGEMKLEQHQIDRIVDKIGTRQHVGVTDA